MLRLKTAIALVCATTVGTTLVSGQNVVAFPQDTTQTDTASLIPLGYAAYGRSTDECRYQMLITAEHLPAPGSIITGIEAWAMTSSPTAYPKLEISLSHLNRGTLDPTFAANTPSPVLVFSQQNTTIPWVAQQWVPLTFRRPFVYDGSRNLVVEIRRIVTPRITIIYLGHGTTDHDAPSRRAIYAAGPPGAGSFTAPVSQNFGPVMRIRLRVSTPSLLLRSNPRALNEPAFGVGDAFDIEVQSNPGTLHAILGSIGFGTPTSVPPLLGLSFVNLVGAVTLQVGAIPASGISSLRMQLPNDAGLVGTRLVFQSPTLRPSGVPAWTNAADCTIQL